MKTEKRVSTRKSVALPEGVNKRLTAYAQAAAAALPEDLSKRFAACALAAGAAGVGVLALAEPELADIVTVTTPITIPGGDPSFGCGLPCTPAISINGRRVLSFNSPDFFGFSRVWRSMKVNPGTFPFRSNFGVGSVVGSPSTGGVAAPLVKGSLIGPGRHFVPGGQLAYRYIDYSFAYPAPSRTKGHWVGKSGYLGFELTSNGQAHFGWVHLDKVEPGASGVISEYAYDTVGGQSIEAGQTSAIPEPGTLSLLALGAAGVAVLRKRKRSAVSQQGSANGQGASPQTDAP
jgi:hypothetical protein